LPQKKKNQTNTKRIFFQIIREFWFQTILSLGWATVSVYFSEGSDNKILSFLTNFFASLFVLSWFAGQFFRIKKQQKVEDEFSKIKKDLNSLLRKIRKQTNDLIGFATGGDSVGYFTPGFWSKDAFVLNFKNTSDYPVFDVEAEWVDLDEPLDRDKLQVHTRHQVKVGYLYPKKIIMNVLKFDLTGKDQFNFNIFTQTRNRYVSQQFRLKRVGKGFKVAFHTRSENFEELEIPEDFPGYDSKNPMKVFETS